MKKTLIALAALASIGSAFAQTAPTIALYGRADVSAGTVSTTGAADKGLQIGSNGYYTSTFGIKGSSDLGNGLKMSGQLEAGFHPDSDSSFTGGAWGRVGKIALEGGFGAVQLGTDWSPYDNAMNDAMDYQHFSAQYAAWSLHGAHADDGNRGDAINGNGNLVKHIQYTTPTVSGFNALIAYAPSKDATTNSDTSYTGWGVNYGAGPLALSLAGEHVPAAVQNGAVIGGTGYTDAWVLTGSYNLGPATVFGGVEQANASLVAGSAKDSGYSLGVKVPLGSWTVSAGWATETTTMDNVADTKGSSYALQALYAWNKNATFYAGANNFVDNTSGKDITTNTFKVGLTYAFN